MSNVARIPLDLRDRDDLTVAEVNRIVFLRKRRAKDATKASDLVNELADVRASIKADESEECQILGVEAPASEPAS